MEATAATTTRNAVTVVRTMLKITCIHTCIDTYIHTVDKLTTHVGFQVSALCIDVVSVEIIISKK